MCQEERQQEVPELVLIFSGAMLVLSATKLKSSFPASMQFHLPATRCPLCRATHRHWNVGTAHSVIGSAACPWPALPSLLPVGWPASRRDTLFMGPGRPRDPGLPCPVEPSPHSHPRLCHPYPLSPQEQTLHHWGGVPFLLLLHKYMGYGTFTSSQPYMSG